MDTILLLTERDRGDWLYGELDRLGPTYWDNVKEKTVKAAGQERRWMKLTRADDVWRGYELEDLERVHAFVPDPSFYIVKSPDRGLYAEFLLLLDPSRPVWVDNEQGWIDTLTAVQQAIRAGQDWFYAEGPPGLEPSMQPR